MKKTKRKLTPNRIVNPKYDGEPIVGWVSTQWQYTPEAKMNLNKNFGRALPIGWCDFAPGKKILVPVLQNGQVVLVPGV